MAINIFVNLPVKDLNASMEFFKKMGFSFKQQFTDNTAACMVVSGNIYVMLLTYEKFKEFTKKEIVDASKVTEVMNGLSVDSKEEVNRLVNIALKAGATETMHPADYGFMFERSFNDLDGHIWSFFWMDPKNIVKD